MGGAAVDVHYPSRHREIDDLFSGLSRRRRRGDDVETIRMFFALVFPTIVAYAFRQDLTIIAGVFGLEFCFV